MAPPILDDGPPSPPTDPPQTDVYRRCQLFLRGTDRVGMYPKRIATAAMASGTPSATDFQSESIG